MMTFAMLLLFCCPGMALDGPALDFWSDVREATQKKEFRTVLNLASKASPEVPFAGPPFAGHLQGLAHAGLGDWDAAMLDFEQAKADPSLRGYALSEQGECLVKLNRKGEAIQALREAAGQLSPGRPRLRTLIRLGQLAQDEGQADILAWAASQIAGQDLKEDEAPFLMWTAFQAASDEAVKMDLLKALVLIYPSEDETRQAISSVDPTRIGVELAFACADVFLRQGHPRDCLAFLDGVKSSLPAEKRGMWTVLRAKGLRDAERLTDACACLKSYLTEGTPPDPAAALLYADYLSRANKTEEALKAYHSCLDLLQDPIQAWEAQWKRALLLEKLGRNDEMRKAMEEVAEKAPPSVSKRASWRLSVDLMRSNEWEKAQIHLRAMAELPDGDEQKGIASLFLAKLCRSSDPLAAEEWLAKALQFCPAGTYYHYRALDLAGSPQAAERIANISLDPQRQVGLSIESDPPNRGDDRLQDLDLSLISSAAAFFLLAGFWDKAEESLESMAKRELASALCRIVALNELERYDKAIGLADLMSRRGGGDLAFSRLFPVHYREAVQAAAERHGVDSRLLWAMMREESRFVKDAFSRAGAQGLMQVMPETGRWAWQRVSGKKQIPNLNDPNVSIEIGAWYLRDLLDQFDGNIVLAVAGYNAGPGRPKSWKESIPTSDVDLFIECVPFSETRNYLKKVLGSYGAYCSLASEIP